MKQEEVERLRDKLQAAITLASESVAPMRPTTVIRRVDLAEGKEFDEFTCFLDLIVDARSCFACEMRFAFSELQRITSAEAFFNYVSTRVQSAAMEISELRDVS